MPDSANEQFILKGDQYLVGKWYSFQKEGKKFAYYKETTNVEDSLINAAEVFYTNVGLTKECNLTLQNTECFAAVFNWLNENAVFY